MLIVTQGADCTVHITAITDAAGAALDVTGWTVIAQARQRPGAVLLAEWRNVPTGSQGTATTDAAGIHLAVPAAMSDPWTWSVAELHCEAHEPVAPNRQARVGEATLYLSRAIVEA